MDKLKPALAVLLLAASLLAESTSAQQAVPPAVPETKAAVPEDKSNANAEAKPAAPAKPPIRRRSVQQTIEHMPASPPIATEGYRPTPAVPPPATPGAPPGPQRPVLINSCDAGGCTDTSGTRYNRGAGNTLLSPQGRLCTGSGPTLQCF